MTLLKQVVLVKRYLKVEILLKKNNEILDLNEEIKSNSSEEFQGFNDEYLEIKTIHKPSLKKRNSSSSLKRNKSLENIKVNQGNINQKEENINQNMLKRINLIKKIIEKIIII